METLTLQVRHCQKSQGIMPNTSEYEDILEMGEAETTGGICPEKGSGSDPKIHFNWFSREAT